MSEGQKTKERPRQESQKVWNTPSLQCILR